MVVILHNIRSLFNVGAIFRTADALGITKIYLIGITPSPIDRFGKIRPQFAKVSLGAEKTVPWEKVRSATLCIKNLKKSGYKIFAIEQDKKSILYYQYKKLEKEKIALVVGHEVKGLSKAILKNCDRILEIPMRGNKESLNVAVAFGVVAFHFRYG